MFCPVEEPDKDILMFLTKASTSVFLLLFCNELAPVSERVRFREFIMLNTQFTKQGKDSCFPCVNQVKKFVMREITKEELDL